MNFLQHIYPGDAVASFMIRVLAEITMVTVAAFVLCRVVAGKNAALRHGICICALLCVLVAPITTLGLEKLGWSTLSISLESERQQVTMAAPYGEDVVVTSAPQPQAFWTLEKARDTASMILIVWALGTGVLLFRLVNGSRKVRSLRRSARPIDDPKLQAALDSIGFPARAPVRFSKKLHSPVVVGPRETTVILPEKLLAQLDETQLRCVLAHEMTHVRQHDPLIGLIQRLVEAGYWPHPLVHVLNRDLVRAREEVCDNAALHGTTAPQYADTLLTVALGMSRTSPTIGVGLMTKKWKLEERVIGLLDPHRRLTTTMNTRQLAFVIVALATGTAIIAGAHVVAAPNPPGLQQIVELTPHYNAKTKKITVAAKISKQKASKTVSAQVKVVKDYPASKTLTYYYTGDKSDATVKTIALAPTMKKGEVYSVALVDGKVQTTKVSSGDSILIAGKDGKSHAVTTQSTTLSELRSDQANRVLSLTTSDDKADTVILQGSDVLAGKSGDSQALTIVSGDAIKLDDEKAQNRADVSTTVTTTTTTKSDGRVETTTISKTPVRSDVPIVGKLFVYDVKGDGKPIEAQIVKDDQDTIKFTPKDGVVYLQMEDSKKVPSVTFTPQFKVQRVLNPQVKYYVRPSDTLKFTLPPVKIDNKVLHYQLKTVPKSKTFTYTVPLTYKVYSAPAGVNKVKYYVMPKKANGTTVYIDGDHIKIVGDNIKVVHVDSKNKSDKKKN